MNKLMMIVLALMLASLACLETTTNTVPTSTPEPTAKATEIESGAVFEIESWTPTPEIFCAIVTAQLSLNVRDQPHDRARVIDYLTQGERVVIEEASGQWWKIITGREIGYSNSFYLQIVPCK